MSIATELTRLAANRDAIKAAIEAKNPATAPTSALSSFPAAITSIPTGGDGGWQKPSNWPDIEAILEQDVTPQAAIDAGATKKWIMLCNPGFPGNDAKAYTFYNGVQVYFRISDGVETVEQSSNTVAPLDNGKPFWIIVYTSNSTARCPAPYFGPYRVTGPLWVHGPDHVFEDWGHNTNAWIRLTRFKAAGMKMYTYNDGFSGCASLQSVDVGVPVNAASGGSGFSSFFSGVKQMDKIDCRNWVTSSTKSVSNFFQAVGARTVDVTGWDTSNVTDFGGLFRDSLITEIRGLSDLDTRNGTSFEYTFNGTCLRKLNLRGWVTSAATRMYGMFRDSSMLDEVDCTGWDTSNVSQGFREMFRYTYSLRTVDLTSWNTSKVTDMSAMFYWSGIKDLDLHNFDVSKVTTFNSMFHVCTYLENLDIYGWNTAAVTNVGNWFYDCRSLRTIIGSRTVAADGSVGGSTAYFGKGPALDLSFAQSSLLEHDSLLYIMYWLPDLSGGAAKTLTLHADAKARLSAAEMAVASAKNWTVA